MDSEYHVDYNRRYRSKKQRDGICRNCLMPVVLGRAVCEAHVQARRDRSARDNAIRYRDADRRAKSMLWSAKQRAVRDGVQCSLTWEWILGCLTAGSCAVTGLPFDLSKHPVFKTHPFAPSIDRIAAGGDYSPANCRVVILAVNAAMNEWGEDIFQQVAAAYMQRHPIA